MVQTKLRQLLAEHNVTPYRFAKTIEACGERSRSWAYRSVRGEIGLTTEGVDLIIRCLRDLTGQPIAVEDILGYVDETHDLALNKKELKEEAQVWDLILRKKTAQEIPPILISSSNSAYGDATYRPSTRSSQRGWWLISLLLVFILGVSSQRIYQSTIDRRELVLLSEPTPEVDPILKTGSL